MAAFDATPILQGLQLRDQREDRDRQIAQQDQLQGLLTNVQNLPPEVDFKQSDAFRQLAVASPKLASQIGGVLGDIGEDRERSLFQDARDVNNRLKSGDVKGSLSLINSRLDNLDRLGGDPKDTLEILADINAGDLSGAIGKLDLTDQVGVDRGFLRDPLEAQRKRETGKSAGEREFESLTKNLTDEQQLQARLVKLGLKPRATGSAIQTITELGLEDEIGRASATIKQREKFAEKTGASRAKTIDSGFERIQKIDTGIRNIDRAVEVLNDGAGVGAIEKFLPSIKASSVALDNIQKSMALDVIGAVTFGALSQGELNLAKEVALPTGLDTPQLIEHLNGRRAAQEKLRQYFNDQIQFLDQGGTVAGFLRSRESEAGNSPQAGSVIRFDAQGNQIQ